MKTLIIVVHPNLTESVIKRISDEMEKIVLAISSRVDENDVNRTGKDKYILKELTRPFELSFEYIKVDYQPAFAFYGMDYNASESNIVLGVRSYLAFLDEL